MSFVVLLLGHVGKQDVTNISPGPCLGASFRTAGASRPSGDIYRSWCSLCRPRLLRATEELSGRDRRKNQLTTMSG